MGVNNLKFCVNFNFSETKYVNNYIYYVSRPAGEIKGVFPLCCRLVLNKGRVVGFSWNSVNF